ncbi:solute carrier organic anion transporter family member 1C1-like [Ptychodera flava]|uniref:solute carrier organic anion transporter family member 1C1-like n=1 Tax=Ptychodera flava TaxID=63121 RepID=UPI003969C962
MAVCLVVLDLVVFCFPFIKMTLGCQNDRIAGVTVPYHSTASKPNFHTQMDLGSTCNSRCACTERYSPVCGSDDVTYYSACHAGCTVSNINKTFEECGCVGKHRNLTENVKERIASRGTCSKPCERDLLIFTILSGIFGTLLAMVVILNVMIILRCVSPTDKPYALGFRAVVTQLFGSMPSPLYTGILIDSACTLWGKTPCGQRGACLLYDLPDYRYKLMGLFGFLKGTSCVFYIVAMVTIFRNPDPGNTDNIQGNQGVFGQTANSEPRPVCDSESNDLDVTSV